MTTFILSFAFDSLIITSTPEKIFYDSLKMIRKSQRNVSSVLYAVIFEEE